MIKAIVLDVDGVIVGEKIGYNSPNPHTSVIRRLAEIRKSGIPVILCTGKPHYAVSDIIDSASLENPHITNGGSVIIDPIQRSVLASYPIDRDTAVAITDTCLSHGLYTEIYTVDDYYIQKNQKNGLTDIHSHILQHPPNLSVNIGTIVRTRDIVKICPVTDTESDMPEVDALLSSFIGSVSFAWSIHPIANPHRFLGITARGISKRKSTQDVLSSLGISPSDTLSVGDSASDLKYMDLTGYAATVENGEPEIKSYVQSKGSDGYIGGHVDSDGILPVFDHFRLP